MDRYQRVEKPRPESTINENEIRITAQGLIRNYISYATSLLQNNREKLPTEIVLKAMGQAISKTVAIAEILKKRTPGLHQDTVISSVSITDIWEPIEEGLVPLEMTRHVSMISISLSTRMLSRNSPGYQPALHIEQPKQQKYHQPKYYNQHQPPRKSPAQFSDGRGRGRGRGRGSGWSQGGYGGYEGYGGYGGYPNNQGYPGKQGYTNNKGYPSNQGYANNQENGEWNNGWGRGGGRGGGRGRGGWGYHDGGYERGRGGGGRGFGRGRGRVGGGRGRRNQLF